MDRKLTLTEFLQSRLGGQLIFSVDPPNAAGVHFEDFGGWKLVVHVGQVVAMSEVLSDEQFLLFSDALVAWAAFVLAYAPTADDLDHAIFQAQTVMAAEFPAAYNLMDLVFGLD